MKILNAHFYALKRALNLLLKGHFLVFFIPGLIIALLFFIYFLLINAVEGIVGLISYTPWIGAYMGTASDSVFSWIHGISIFFYQFTIITLLSPFHTMLSQRVETHENGKTFSSNPSKFFNDIIRTIGVVIVGGLLYLFVYLLWTFIGWFLGLTFLSPYLSLIFIAFFTGFNSYDYSLERHNVKVLDSWKYAFNHPLQMILTGLLFTFLLYIPILGVVIAPVLLTMVGTINYLEIEKEK